MAKLPIKTFLPEGFWMANCEKSLRQKRVIEGDLSYDVVVIGGGFTGLSSAIALAETGASVAILERGQISSGASGHNCGQVGIQLGMNPRYTLKYLGLERTRMYADVLQKAIANVRNMVDRSGRDCNYLEIGNLTTGVHADQLKVVEDTYAACEKVGLPVRMLDRSALDKMDIPKFVANAFHELIGGAIQPAKYAYALADIAESLGVHIYENAHVNYLEPGMTVRAHVGRSIVSAPRCVLATNAYTSEIGLMNRSYIPYSVSVLVSEPLTPEQRAKVGWSGEHPLHTPHKMIENIRLTPDGRILIGTKRARLGFGNHHPMPESRYSFGALAKVLRERFPELPDLKPDIGWTGRIALSPDGIPFFTYLNGQKNIVFGGAYSGHGIAMASYSGTILAKMLNEEDASEYGVFIDRKRPPVPPEPLRWLLAQSVGAAMKYSDNRIDALARAAIPQSRD
jgi:gamma-glutamylputrescine oxidase